MGQVCQGALCYYESSSVYYEMYYKRERWLKFLKNVLKNFNVIAWNLEKKLGRIDSFIMLIHLSQRIVLHFWFKFFIYSIFFIF